MAVRLKKFKKLLSDFAAFHINILCNRYAIPARIQETSAKQCSNGNANNFAEVPNQLSTAYVPDKTLLITSAGKPFPAR